MNSLLARCAAAGLIATAATLAHAQAAPGLSLGPVNAGTSADELLRAADYAIQQIDAGHYETVYADAAPFVKARYDAQRFANDTRLSRQAVGAIKSRGWAAVTRIVYKGAKDIPDGLYANVDYATTQSSDKVVFEKLSFRLETDGRWHLTGYVPRIAQGPVPGVAQGALPAPGPTPQQ